MPRWLISHPACGFSLCETYRREGKNLPITHPALTRITTATEEPFVSVPNSLPLRLASKNVLQVPPMLPLNGLQGEGSCSEGWESPFLPRGQAGGSSDGSSRRRGWVSNGAVACLGRAAVGFGRAGSVSACPPSGSLGEKPWGAQARGERCGREPPHASASAQASVQCASV